MYAVRDRGSFLRGPFLRNCNLVYYICGQGGVCDVEMMMTEAYYILECAAIDLVGQLAPMEEDSPSAQLIIKRIKAIDIAQEALLQCGADIPKGV